MSALNDGALTLLVDKPGHSHESEHLSFSHFSKWVSHLCESRTGKDSYLSEMLPPVWMDLAVLLVHGA